MSSTVTESQRPHQTTLPALPGAQVALALLPTSKPFHALHWPSPFEPLHGWLFLLNHHLVAQAPSLAGYFPFSGPSSILMLHSLLVTTSRTQPPPNLPFFPQGIGCLLSSSLPSFWSLSGQVPIRNPHHLLSSYVLRISVLELPTHS